MRSPQPDFLGEYQRVRRLFQAAIEVHKMAIARRSQHNQASELLTGFYEALCEDASADLTLRNAITTTLVSLAANDPKGSPLVRGTRYAWAVKAAVWPSKEDGGHSLLFPSTGALSKKDLQLAIQAVAGAAKALLRSLPVPDAAQELEEMEREACRAEEYAKLSDEGKATAIVQSSKPASRTRSTGSAKTNRRGRPTKKETSQRAEFAKPLAEKGLKWSEIFELYAKSPKGKIDKTASPDRMRLAFHREYSAE